MVCNIPIRCLLKPCSSSISLNQIRSVNFLFSQHHFSRLNLSSYTSIATRSSPLSDGMVLLDEPSTSMSSLSSSLSISQQPWNAASSVKIDTFNHVDEKFRLFLASKTVAQMFTFLQENRHEINLIQFRTFIKQISMIGPLKNYQLKPEYFDLLHEMLFSFPEMLTPDGLLDASLLFQHIRVPSSLPLHQAIALELIDRVDDLSFIQMLKIYKNFPFVAGDAVQPTNLNAALINDSVARARYLLISNIAFKVEVLNFDPTDLNILCDVFHRVNLELYAKDAIDTLVRSIAVMKNFLRPRHATDLLFGLMSPYGSKIWQKVQRSKNVELKEQYNELMKAAINSIYRSNSPSKYHNFKASTSSTVFECISKTLLKLDDNFDKQKLWNNLLNEITFHQRRLKLMDWQNIIILFIRFNSCPPSLIDLSASILMANYKEYLEDVNLSPQPYIKMMSQAYHKPTTVDWAKFKAILLHPSKLLRIPNERVLTILSKLAVLGEYSTLKDFNLNGNLTHSSFWESSRYKKLLMIYSGSFHEKNELDNDSWLCKSETDTLIRKSISLINRDLRRAPYSILQSSLETAFGGPEFLVHVAWTRFGLNLSHLLVFRKGEYPIAIRNADDKLDRIVYVDELPLPPEAKVVSVEPIYPWFYNRNFGKSLQGKFLFKFRLIKKANIIPVLVNIWEFEPLSEHEKIPWLINKIRSALMEESSDSWEFIR